MKKTKLSVVIVNYNTGNQLKECIDSVKKTTENLKDPPSEIIVVDNASRDGSFKILKKEKNVKLFPNKENKGFSKAVNQGMKIAEGEYILLLNPDTVIKKDAIQKLLNFAENTVDCGAVGPKLLNSDGSIQPSVFKLPTLYYAILEYWLGQKDKYSKYTPPAGRTTAVEALVMACFLISPKAFKKVGFLDEKFFMYFEDLDYCKRIRDASFKVYYLPHAEVIHYHGTSGKNLAEAQNQWKRLIPSSKKYHGALMHYLITFVLWTGQKWQKLKKQ
jgi:GT2 family glycosyltransferase